MNNKIRFGTDGVRGNAEQFPFTPKALNQLGQALHTWLTTKEDQSLKILIAYDTRVSGERIISNLCSGLLPHNVTIHHAGILPTPAVCSVMQRDQSYDLGIMVSASHNPYHDNGLKFFTTGGNKLSADDEAGIITAFNEVSSPNTSVIGTLSKVHLLELYQEHLLSFFPAKLLNNKKIVIDCANGATAHSAPEIFRQLGADVIVLSATPSGTNINDSCGALHPSNLQKAVLAHQAYAGFAFDGDGDRIIAVNQAGELRNGDDILWMLARSEPYKEAHALVGTIMANAGLKKALEKENRSLINVDVGDKHVLRELITKQLLLGGESSGHIILRDYLPICDGVFVALRLLAEMISTNNRDMKSFTHYPQTLLNIPVVEKKDLSQAPYADVINRYRATLDDGRILVRYSGTENVLRVMAETPNKEESQEIAEKLGNELKLQLQ